MLSKTVLQSPDTFIAAIQQAQLTQPNKRILYYVDQFEELFSHQEINREQAQQLAPLLAQLAKQIPHLDIVISIRSEYEDILGKYGNVSHVNPKLNPNEWGDIVYKQATSFGLSYEPELEKRIINEASSIQHALPALEYLLEQLYKKAKLADENAKTLTHAHYEQLNGIKGVIAARAEEVIAKHPMQAHAFFEYFVGLNNEDKPYAKSVNIDGVQQDNEALYGLIESFVDAQLVVDCSTETERRVKLAHDTLLNFNKEDAAWAALKAWFEENKEYLTWLNAISGDFNRWLILNLTQEKSTTNKKDNQSTAFLLKEHDLSAGQKFQQANRIQQPMVREYIAQSQQQKETLLKQKNKKQRLVILLVSVFLLIAVVAGFVAYQKEQEAVFQREQAIKERKRAENLLSQVRKNISFYNSDLRKVLKRYTPIDIRIDMLKRIDNLIRTLEQDDDVTLKDQHQAARALMTKAMVISKSDKDSNQKVFSLLAESQKILVALMLKNPSDFDVSYDFSTVSALLGDALTEMGSYQGAKSFTHNALKVKKRLVSKRFSSPQLQIDISMLQGKLCELYLMSEDILEAQRYCENSMSTSENLIALEKNNAEYLFHLSFSQNKLADLYLRLEKTEESLKLYQEAIKIREKLVEKHPLDNEYLLSLSVVLNKAGHIFLYMNQDEKALTYYKASEEIRNKLIEKDPNNVELQKHLLLSKLSISQAYLKTDKKQLALKQSQMALKLARTFYNINSFKQMSQDLLIKAYGDLGDVYLQIGKKQEALKQYQAAVKIVKTEIQRVPSDFNGQLNLLNLYRRVTLSYLNNNLEQLGSKFFIQGFQALNLNVINEDTVNQKLTLFNKYSGEFPTWSWFLTFAHKETEAMGILASIIKHLPKDSEGAASVSINLVYANLLLGDFASAKSVCKKFKGYTFNDGRTWKKALVLGFNKVAIDGVSLPVFESLINEVF
jgi:tetratricopeptide (TPR) repeat protein